MASLLRTAHLRNTDGFVQATLDKLARVTTEISDISDSIPAAQKNSDQQKVLLLFRGFPTKNQRSPFKQNLTLNCLSIASHCEQFCSGKNETENGKYKNKGCFC